MIKRGWFIVVLALAVAAAVAAFASSGFGGAGATPSQQLASWVGQYDLGSSIGTMHGDDASVTNVLKQHGGVAAVHTVCGALTTDAASGNGNLPTPDTEVTQWLARGYDLEYQAGIDCYDATTNTALQAKATTEMAQAQQLFDRVLVRVQALTGKTVSTTTTTSPDVGGIFG